MAAKVKTDMKFTRDVAKRSGVDVTACYQCLKCSAGCPVSDKSDSTPAHIIRMVTLGMKEELLKSDFIWMCIGCETCKTRCPQDISTRLVVDILKETALREGVEPAQKNIALFQKTFLNIVNARGRMNEPLLMAYYKLGTRDIKTDMDLGMKMIRKGKMGLNPLSGRIKGAGEVREILKGKEGA